MKKDYDGPLYAPWSAVVSGKKRWIDYSDYVRYNKEEPPTSMETYDQQRKTRLADVILDYLNDDDIDARRTYEDLLSETRDVIEYHQKHLTKAEQFYELLSGYGPIDFDKIREMENTPPLED